MLKSDEIEALRNQLSTIKSIIWQDEQEKSKQKELRKQKATIHLCKYCNHKYQNLYICNLCKTETCGRCVKSWGFGGKRCPGCHVETNDYPEESKEEEPPIRKPVIRF